MTIPEAVQLVIQASAMSKGGEVFVLDMGDPVRILDLAQNMVKLMGLKLQSPNENGIEISFTGLRPGEKLYEELLIGDNCVGTNHPKITRAMESMLPIETIKSQVDEIRSACDSLDTSKIVATLHSVVPEYQPVQTNYRKVISFTSTRPR